MTIMQEALPANKMTAVMTVLFSPSSLETSSVCFCRLENLLNSTGEALASLWNLYESAAKNSAGNSVEIGYYF